LRIWAAKLLATVVAVALAAAAFAQDRTADLRARFERETNPVQKAKLMPDLGEAEFQKIRADADADQFSSALKGLREYEAQVDTCVKGLEVLKLDAAKHPSGFKQLQISVQESLRRIDGLLPAMTSDKQAPFLELRKELDGANRQLIEQLFPKQTPPRKPDKPVE